MSKTPEPLPEKILLVLPEVFNCAGGIQMFCRSLCLAAGKWADTHNGSVTALVLNDKDDPDRRYVNRGFGSYIGAGKSKSKFIRHFLRQVLSFQYGWIFFGHVSFSPFALLAKLINPKVKTAVMTYGNEVWQPLTRLQQRALSKVDVVLAISDHTKSELVKHSAIPAEKIKILPCVLDPHWELLVTPNFVSNPPVILSVARMNKEDRDKGIDTVIKSLPAVISRVGPIAYHVIGEGDDVPRLKTLAAELGLTDQVIFLGGLPEAALREQYQRCSVFVLPSSQEGFGIVFLEAMAFSKPVIGGQQGGTPFVVKDKETGWLVDNSDVSAIADTITRFLSDDELRNKLGLAGHERLIQEFTFPKFEHNLNEILHQTAAI